MQSQCCEERASYCKTVKINLSCVTSCKFRKECYPYNARTTGQCRQPHYQAFKSSASHEWSLDLVKKCLRTTKNCLHTKISRIWKLVDWERVHCLHPPPPPPPLPPPAHTAGVWWLQYNVHNSSPTTLIRLETPIIDSTHGGIAAKHWFWVWSRNMLLQATQNYGCVAVISRL